jgi:hypothetical protein
MTSEEMEKKYGKDYAAITLSVSTKDAWDESICGDCPADLTEHCKTSGKDREDCKVTVKELKTLNDAATKLKDACLKGGGSGEIRPREHTTTFNGVCT